MPVYAPYVIWLGFPMVVYEESIYVSGPETIVEEEYYYEDGEYADEGADASATQTYTVWEDGDEESYPWESEEEYVDDGSAEEEYAEEGYDSEMEPEDGNYGTVEPEPLPAGLPGQPELYQAQMAAEALAEINRYRAEAGLEPLMVDERLSLAAARHAEEMQRLSFFDHESPTEENRTLPQRLVRAGVQKYGWAGENIAMTSNPAASELVSMWMKSEGHKENVLRGEFKYTGIAIYGTGDKLYAVQVFSSDR